MSNKNHHDKIERSVGLLAILTIVAISFGTLVLITPLFFMDETTQPVDGMAPYTALQLEGRDIYIREGCVGCHSQMVRPFRAEVERYGHYSVAGESVWDHPFLWGSKRTGPDLARVGQRYSDDWHFAHLMDPRSVVPQSNMPGFPWLTLHGIRCTCYIFVRVWHVIHAHHFHFLSCVLAIENIFIQPWEAWHI